MSELNTIPKDITEELDSLHIPKANTEIAITLAKELNIKITELKEYIISIFNNEIGKLNNNEISLYYSIYLYLIEKEKIDSPNSNKKDKLKYAKLCYQKREPKNCMIILKLLDKEQLVELIYYIYYYKSHNKGTKEYYYSRHSNENFSLLVRNIDKKIIIDILINDIKPIFNSNTLTNGKSHQIFFLEKISLLDYEKFKKLIFHKNYTKNKYFFIILKYFIRYTKTEKYNSMKRGSMEEEFQGYFEALKNNNKSK